MQKRIAIAGLTLGMLLAGASVHAQQATHPCARVVVPTERLACYDKAFPLLPDVREAQRQQAIDDFGKHAGKPKPAQAATPDRVQAGVAGVEHADGAQLITLDNGQRWRSADATHVAVGDAVVLHRGALGSYLMTMPNGVQLRVRREH